MVKLKISCAFNIAHMLLHVLNKQSIFGVCNWSSHRKDPHYETFEKKETLYPHFFVQSFYTTYTYTVHIQSLNKQWLAWFYIES
jgi:hypothetical protein